MRKIVLFLFIILFCSILQAEERDKKKILIFDFQDIAQSVKYGYLSQSIPDSMGTSFIKEGEFHLIRRDKWMGVVDDLDIDIKRSLDEDQVIAIGRALDADAVIYGNFFVVGDYIRINSKAINLYNGEIITGIQVQGKTGLDVFDLVDEVTKKITGEVKKEFVNIEKMKKAGKTWFGATMRSTALPGWGQIYNDQPWKSYIIWGTGLTIVTSTVTTHLLYEKAKEDYEGLGLVSSTVYDEKYNKMNDYYQYRKYSLYAFLIYYVLNIADAGITGALKYRDKTKLSYHMDYSKDIRIAWNYRW